MRRSKAKELGVKILAKYVTTAVAGECPPIIAKIEFDLTPPGTQGVPPRIMGIGPSIAIPKVLSQAGILKEDVDLFEVIPPNYLDQSAD